VSRPPPLGLHHIDPIEALVGGAVHLTGIPAAVPRCLRLIGLGRADTEAKATGPVPPAPTESIACVVDQAVPDKASSRRGGLITAAARAFPASKQVSS